MSEFQPITAPKPVKLTVSDYELLLESGALDRFQHVELIEGVIVEMNSERSRHGIAKNEITFRLRDKLRDMRSDLTARCEPTIELSSHSLPEPDAIVVNPRAASNDYVAGSDVAIVIEVAHSTRANDIRYKYQLYSKHDLPEYWIFDLNDDVIHVFWRPSANGYSEQATIALGKRLESRTIPGLSIETANLY